MDVYVLWTAVSRLSMKARFSWIKLSFSGTKHFIKVANMYYEYGIIWGRIGYG